MSIDIEWEVSEAPRDTTGTLPPPPPPRPSLPAVKPPPEPRLKRSKLWWVGLASMLGILVIGGLWAWRIALSGWEKINTDVAAAVQLEEKLAHDGQADSSLDHTPNFEWKNMRVALLRSRLPAPDPAPRLHLTEAPPIVLSIAALEVDMVQANVARAYLTSEGNAAIFQVPQYYQQDPMAGWVRIAPPSTIWGELRAWTGSYVHVRYYAFDEAVVNQVAPRLDAQIARACQLWAKVCARWPLPKLYLSSNLVAVTYNPLQSIEVVLDVPPADVVTRRNDPYPRNFLSVASPQLMGIPQDEVGLTALADSWAVRVIAAMGRRSNNPTYNVIPIIETMNLRYIDPGFTHIQTLEPDTPVGASIATGDPSIPAISGAYTPSRVWYTVQPGDTLTSIAEQHGVSLGALIQYNHLTDPDALLVGQVLIVPLQ